MSITKNQDKILLYTENIGNILRFSGLKSKLFLYCYTKKNNIPLKNNFILVENKKNIPKMLFLNILLIVLIKKKANCFLLEMLTNIPKLKTIILIEEKKTSFKYHKKNNEQLFYELDLKFFSKKKQLFSKNVDGYSIYNENKFLIKRRKKLPKICISKTQKIIKFLVHRYNKKFGVIFKSTYFFVSINSLFYFNRPIKLVVCSLRKNFEENFQRLADELGVLVSRISSFKIKAVLYIISSLIN